MGYAHTAIMAVKPRRFYISPTGSNANRGTSPEFPWKDLTPLNTVKIRGGDSVLFDADNGTHDLTTSWTVQGGINVSTATGEFPTASTPITVGKYGAASTATLRNTGTGTGAGGAPVAGDEGKNCGLLVRYAGSVNISDLNVVGVNSAWTTFNAAVSGIGTGRQKQSGFGIAVVDGDGSHAPHSSTVKITNCTATNWRIGISIGSQVGTATTDQGHRFNAELDSCTVNACTNIGISTYGTSSGGLTGGNLARLYNESLYIHDCLVYDVYGAQASPGGAYSANSGHGIRANYATNGIIERCVAHDLGANYGNLNCGIWFFECTNSVIRYCESYRVFRAKSVVLAGSDDFDSTGFDIDGGNQGCVLEHCYAHDCDGGAAIFAHFAGASRPTSGNIMRFVVGINNGNSATGAKDSAAQFWTDNSVAVGSGLHNNLQHNCTFIDRAGDYSVWLSNSSRNSQQILANSILWADRVTAGKPITEFNLGTKANQTVLGNTYWDVDAAGASLKLDNTLYTSLATARAATGHESYSSVDYGTIANPNFTVLPATAPTVPISGRPTASFLASMRSALSSVAANLKPTNPGAPAPAAAMNQYASLYASTGVDFFGTPYSAPFTGVAVP